MPVNYGVLRGKIVDAIPYQHGADHYQIEVDANGTLYRIAVDVYSQFSSPIQSHYRHGNNNQPLETDRMVMYYKDENYQHDILVSILNQVNVGFTAKANMPQELLLDYLRYNPALFDINQMTVVPPKDPSGNGPDLNGDIDPWVQRAKNNDHAEVFAFGSGWDDNAAGGHPDVREYFHPNPSVGIHDIHMNQGDTGREAHYNGTWQDGALFLYFTDEPGAGTWVAMFFRFQNQSITTDDNGNATT